MKRKEANLPRKKNGDAKGPGHDTNIIVTVAKLDGQIRHSLGNTLHLNDKNMNI
jgi:hypothetical protein